MRFFKNKQFEMLWRVSDFLKAKEKDLCLKVPGFKEYIDDFNVSFTQIKDMVTKDYNKFLRGANKKGAKDKLVAAVMKIIAAIKVHAHRQKDAQMLKDYVVSKSKLSRSSSQFIAGHSKAVIDAAKKIHALKQLGVSPEYITMTEKLHKAYDDLKETPAKRKKQFAMKNTEINNLIKESVYSLETQIDSLIDIASAEDSKIGLRYYKLRKVLLDKKGRRRVEEVRYRTSRKRKSTRK